MAAAASSTAENRDDDVREAFRWLRNDGRGPTYTSYSQLETLPACSFDWGAHGYAGCSSHGGELLYLSVPSPTQGLAVVRGRFSTSLYSSLSRAQRDFGGPATFGLEISRSDYEYDPRSSDPNALKGSSFHLGRPIDRGCFNYRWPVNEYFLDLGKHCPVRQENEQVEEKHVGTCTMFSCAKDGVFYQVLRIDDGGHFDNDGISGAHRSNEHGDSFPSQCRHFPEESQVVLTMGGPVWFHSFDKDRLFDFVVDRGSNKPTATFARKALSREPESVVDRSIKDKPTPEVETGSSSTSQPGPSGDGQNVPVGSSADETNYHTIQYYDTGRRIGLRASVFQLMPDGTYERLALTRSTAAADSGPPAARSKLTAYNATVELPRDKGKKAHSPQRSATFLAAICLFEIDDKDNVVGQPLPNVGSLPTSRQLYDYIGVHPSQKHATGAMWDNIFLSADIRPDSVSELAEVGFVGRCLEKILQVDCVITSFHNDNDQNNPKKPDLLLESQELDLPISREVALVSNLFIRPNVDLKSLFWKVRFLIQTHKFLSRILEGNIPHQRPRTARSKSHLRAPSGEQPERVSNGMPDSRREIVKHQVVRIGRYIEAIIRYLVKAMLQSDFETPLLPDSHIAGESNYYYVTTTVWYAIRNFGDGAWDWKTSLLEANPGSTSHPKQLCRLFSSNRLPSEHWTFSAIDREKVTILRWFHHASILELHRAGYLSDHWCPPGFADKVNQLATAAKITAASKASRRAQYVAEDEIFDRLSLVSDELFLEPLDPGDIGAVTLSSIKRIKSRDYTRVLNPGWYSSQVNNGSTSGPWEIHALCHHSRLAVYYVEHEEQYDWRRGEHIAEEVDSYKRKLFRFLNAEGTLIPTWERAHSLARKGFLRSESTAVVASTLLALYCKSMSHPSGASHGQDSSSGEGSVSAINPGETRLGERKLIQEVLYVENLLQEQLEVLEKSTGEANRSPPIRWETFAPSRHYHPENFVQSLEDTPEVYENVPVHVDEASKSSPFMVRPNNRPLSRPETFTNDNLNDESTLRHISVSDIRATETLLNSQGFAKPITFRFLEDLKSSEKKEEQSKFELSKEKLIWALYDSLVDQEVQHRFFVVRNLSMSMLPAKLHKLLAYVIHPEATPCLNNHSLRFSRFFCRKQDTWVAGITLRAWHVTQSDNIQPSPPRPSRRSGPTSATAAQSNSATQAPPPRVPGLPATQSDLALSPFPDDKPMVPPRNLKDIWPEHQKNLLSTLSFELRVSSIVVSTNSFGDFSKCTILSDLIPPEDMSCLMDEARMLWQKFIHQPQTARCLVFFLVLSKMGQSIADNYDYALQALIPIMKLEDSFTSTQSQWREKNDTAILDFELSLWGLESLYKLQTSLNASLESLLESKQELLAQVKDGPGRRSARLERLCQEYLGDFEASAVRLAAVNTKLERRIELYTRYRDSFAAVLAMSHSVASLAQNHLSLQQNEIAVEQSYYSMKQTEISMKQSYTVQRLTYLTIGYLPMGLLAAIFAIPDSESVDFQNMGVWWFIGAVFIVSGVTFILAAFIGEILDFFKWPPPPAIEALSNEGEDEETNSNTTGSSVSVKGSASGSQQFNRRPPRNLWRILFPKYVDRKFPQPKPMLPSVRIKSMREKSVLPASSAP